jgi:hypothetical protein
MRRFSSRHSPRPNAKPDLRLEVLAGAISWGFKSPSPHQILKGLFVELRTRLNIEIGHCSGLMRIGGLRSSFVEQVAAENKRLQETHGRTYEASLVPKTSEGHFDNWLLRSSERDSFIGYVADESRYDTPERHLRGT